MGLYHNSTIINAECKFEVFAFWFLFLAPIAIFLRLFFKFTFIRRGHKCTRFMNWPSKFFYSQTSMLLITCFQPLFVTSVMEIRQVDFSTGYAILSYTIAIVVSLLCLFTFLSVWLVNMKNFKNYRQISVKKIFESYVTPMRRKSFVAFLYWPLFITKTLIIAIILVFVNSGWAHTGVSVAFSLGMFIYICAARPFKNHLNTAMAALYELVIFIYMNLQWVICDRPEDPQFKRPVAVIQMILVCLTGLLALLLTVIIVGISIVKWLANRNGIPIRKLLFGKKKDPYSDIFD